MRWDRKRPPELNPFLPSDDPISTYIAQVDRDHKWALERLAAGESLASVVRTLRFRYWRANRHLLGRDFNRRADGFPSVPR